MGDEEKPLFHEYAVWRDVLEGNWHLGPFKDGSTIDGWRDIFALIERQGLDIIAVIAEHGMAGQSSSLGRERDRAGDLLSEGTSYGGFQVDLYRIFLRRRET